MYIILWYKNWLKPLYSAGKEAEEDKRKVEEER